MKTLLKHIPCFALVLVMTPCLTHAASEVPAHADVKIGGYLGQRLDACFDRSVKATNGQYLTDIFKQRTETRTWQTEFWGKWMHAAVPFYQYTGDAELKANIDASVKNLLGTQRADGYIGNYTDEAQLKGPWDIWGRKYTMLGLLHYYDLTEEPAVLQAACRVADHLMTQVGPGGHDIYKVGNYHGMASCSVLEPIVWLHNRTGEKKYLDFAKYIVSQLEDPSDSAKLITKALDGVDVGSRFGHPEKWWSWENGMKAYEMMSCYQGLLEYYQATGDQRALEASVATAQNIIATEINAAGSGAAFECWYHGAERETTPAYHMMETCVTTTWMRLCETLLRLTGDPAYADQIEKTLYNAYLASLSHDATTYSKYCPLEGMRGRGEDQCGMTTNCCIANGPRGFVALMESLVLAQDDALFVNLYTASKASLTLPATGNRVTVEQLTDYPVGEMIELKVTPKRAAKFKVMLRIPAWSQSSSAAVNGQAFAAVPAGAYLAIERQWQAGDAITLKLDLRGRGRMKNGHLVLERGPITLARDARFDDGDIHDVIGGVDVSKPIPLKVEQSADENIWMAFTLPQRVGLNLEAARGEPLTPIHFCDFASAGNTWEADSVYRVWQRIPINVMKTPYTPYNVPAN